MRITNKMMTNNSLNNINKNKNKMNTLDQQYSTGKKIQRPSEDPIVAVRALKLRTTVTEINQYYNKNIPDAMSWMDVTESALKNVNTVLTNIHTQLNQGANDTLSKSDRDGIVKNLEEMKSQIYQEGNSNYAGRYVFTGYKTNTSLIFNEPSNTINYDITENFAGPDIEIIETVNGAYKVADYNPATSTVASFGTAPNALEGYRIRLSYDDLDTTLPAVTYLDTSTTPPTPTPVTIVKKSITGADGNPYTPAANEANFIPETGELILSKGVYDNLRLQEENAIKVIYNKTNFEKGDLRPEHYFTCTTTDTAAPVPAATAVTYDNSKDQFINYEITFNQKIQINVQGKDAIKHDIGRVIDELKYAVEEVTETEGKISEVEKLMESPDTTPAQKEVLAQLKEQMNTELVLRNKILQDKFESGLTSVEKYQEEVNITIADAGSRYVRLELTDSRLDTQLVDSKELLSNNEDADLAEVIINYTAAENIYNSSLTAASKIVKNTLLDFI